MRTIKININPYRRVEEARRILAANGESSDDIWVNKLVDIFRVRDLFIEKYKQDYYRHWERKCPQYAKLLRAFEDTRVGGDRDLLEACLLASADCSKISEQLNDKRFDPMFLSIYRELFYDVSAILGNPVAEFQYIIAPMAQATSNKLAVGHLWKILAISGGLKLLYTKGFGTEPIRGDDIQRLIQLASYRNCSMLLQYSAEGVPFFEDNPAGMNILATIADMATIRGRGRRSDYLAELSDTAKNNLSSLLDGEIKLISAPRDVIESLTELDGIFFPEKEGALEITQDLTYSDTKGDNDDDR